MTADRFKRAMSRAILRGATLPTQGLQRNHDPPSASLTPRGDLDVWRVATLDRYVHFVCLNLYF